MKVFWFSCSLLLSGLAACSSSPLPPSAQLKPEPVREVMGQERLEGRIIGRLAPGSVFSVLEIGMKRAEVEKLIGAPKLVDAQSAGVGWMPFYFGSDAWSTESYYKGEGRLVFNADSRLILIDVSERARK